MQVRVQVVLGYVSVGPWDPTRRVFPLHHVCVTRLLGSCLLRLPVERLLEPPSLLIAPLIFRVNLFTY